MKKRKKGKKGNNKTSLQQHRRKKGSSKQVVTFAISILIQSRLNRLASLLLQDYRKQKQKKLPVTIKEKSETLNAKKSYELEDIEKMLDEGVAELTKEEFEGMLRVGKPDDAEYEKLKNQSTKTDDERNKLRQDLRKHAICRVQSLLKRK